MNSLAEKVRDYGGDLPGIEGRFLGDWELYESCFRSFLEDEAFAKLGEALAAADYQQAFEQAHTLKGVTGNMGLTPLYWVLCSLVEALRGKEEASLEELYAKVLAQLALIGDFLN